MRAELKIGIAVGLIIAAVAVLYVVFHDTGPKGPKGGAQLGPAPPVVTPRVAPTTPPAGETLVPSFAGRPSPAPAPTPMAELAELTPGAETTTRPAAPEATRAEAPLAVAITPPTTQPTGAPVAPLVTPAAALASTTTTYVVKEGDKGFWDIAEKVYGPGKGKFWAQIAKANPQVTDPTRLKPGMKLTIPPAPGQPVAASPLVTPLPAAGERVYTVQSDDGWWVISRKVYGDGKYWRELRQANPDMEGVLKVGQRIRIPPLDVIRPTAPSAPAAPAVPAAPAAPAAPTPSDDRPIFD